jgi:hypothetical protein
VFHMAAGPRRAVADGVCQHGGLMACAICYRVDGTSANAHRRVGGQPAPTHPTNDTPSCVARETALNSDWASRACRRFRFGGINKHPN